MCNGFNILVISFQNAAVAQNIFSLKLIHIDTS